MNSTCSVCPRADIRKLTSLEPMTHCTVVEGDLLIAFIWLPHNVSFNQLREITGSLLLYDVDGLSSLSKLFPKLNVIRGHSLIYNYALVIRETALQVSFSLSHCFSLPYSAKTPDHFSEEGGSNLEKDDDDHRRDTYNKANFTNRCQAHDVHKSSDKARDGEPQYGGGWVSRVAAGTLLLQLAKCSHGTKRFE
ncbi:unnamed protein product [Echinostoma caproni]|uniref:Recep_L_domain domain-containing protein n=1 Tax=Echinostoma caproni TaxID=27848 RepID=A0A183B4Y1_9TREM|nr:unnamed protein product [Echinostoma caproni]